MSLRRVAPAVLVAALMLGACGGGSTSTKKSAQPAATGTAWNQVLHQIGPTGSVSKDNALQAFSLAFGPLPVVTVPPGPVGTGADASEALRWTLQYYGQLTPEQRAIVDKVLAGQKVGGPGKTRHADGPGTQQFRKIVDFVIASYAPLVGPLTLTTTIENVAPYLHSYAYVFGRNAQHGLTGTASECFIGITPDGAKASVGELKAYLGHEIFHCYQAQWLGSLSAFYDTTASPSWVIEGAATWAGMNYAPVTIPWSANWWAPYLADPAKPLFTRTYDALGYYGQAQWSGVDNWKLLKTFIQTNGNEARYHVLADPGGDRFLDTWASGLYRRANLGSPWVITSPFVPTRQEIATPMTDLTVTSGTTAPIKAAAYTNALYGVTANADVLHVALTGHGRLADSYGFDSAQLSDVFFCTKDGGSCPCPGDTAGGSGGENALPASRQKLKGGISLGVTGGNKGASGTLEGLTLDDFCKRQTQGPCRLLDQQVIKTATGLDVKPGVQKQTGNGPSCIWATDITVNSPFANVPGGGGGIFPGPTTKASVALIVFNGDDGGASSSDDDSGSEPPVPLSVSGAQQAVMKEGDQSVSQTTAIVVAGPKGKPNVISMFVFGATPGVSGSTLLAQTSTNRF